MIDKDIGVCKLINDYLPVKIKGVWIFVFERDEKQEILKLHN